MTNHFSPLKRHRKDIWEWAKGGACYGFCIGAVILIFTDNWFCPLWTAIIGLLLMVLISVCYYSPKFIYYTVFTLIMACGFYYEFIAPVSQTTQNNNPPAPVEQTDVYANVTESVVDLCEADYSLSPAAADAEILNPIELIGQIFSADSHWGIYITGSMLTICLALAIWSWHMVGSRRVDLANFWSKQKAVKVKVPPILFVPFLVACAIEILWFTITPDPGTLLDTTMPSRETDGWLLTTIVGFIGAFGIGLQGLMAYKLYELSEFESDINLYGSIAIAGVATLLMAYSYFCAYWIWLIWLPLFEGAAFGQLLMYESEFEKSERERKKAEAEANSKWEYLKYGDLCDYGGGGGGGGGGGFSSNDELSRMARENEAYRRQRRAAREDERREKEWEYEQAMRGANLYDCPYWVQRFGEERCTFHDPFGEARGCHVGGSVLSCSHFRNAIREKFK